MKNKFLYFLILFMFVSACSGFKPRSQKSEEFLIEKKNPLVMPPDIDELPMPKGASIENESDNEFEKVIGTNTKNDSSNVSDNNSLNKSIIEKIEE